jgi:hypothetical protein
MQNIDPLPKLDFTKAFRDAEVSIHAFYMKINPAIVFNSFVLSLFALTPLTNLHHFLICAPSLSV